MMREDIRRRALRAAAAVSLTLGVAGCAGHIEAQSEGAGGGDTRVAGTGGEGGTRVAGTGGAGGAGGASTSTAEGGAATADAGSTLADAGLACPMTLPQADWVMCCQAHQFAPSAGCQAWGPPMPPAMPEVLS